MLMEVLHKEAFDFLIRELLDALLIWGIDFLIWNQDHLLQELPENWPILLNMVHIQEYGTIGKGPYFAILDSLSDVVCPHQYRKSTSRITSYNDFLSFGIQPQHIFQAL